MSRPVYRITFSRKDGQEIEFTNYKGETVSKKYAPLGALFARDKGEGYSLAIDQAAVGHEIDAETYFYNVYPTDRDDQPRGGQQRRPAGKPQGARRQPAKTDDGDLNF